MRRTERRPALNCSGYLAVPFLPGVISNHHLHRHTYPMPSRCNVDAAKMSEDGFKFFLSSNGVWLTDSVPPRYLA